MLGFGGVSYFYQEVKYLEGTVKRWLDRGYGFIGVEGNDDDVFVHHSNLDGVYELREGQNVEFDLEDSPKGPRAVNVKIVE
jgi:CspA family cold shock protein